MLRHDSGMKGSGSRPRGEVRGDVPARAGVRVEELGSVGEVVQVQPVDGIGRQVQGVGFDRTRPCSQVGTTTLALAGTSEAGSSSSSLCSGLVGSKWAVGPLQPESSMGKVSKVVEALEVGPDGLLGLLGKGRATGSGLSTPYKERPGLACLSLVRVGSY